MSQAPENDLEDEARALLRPAREPLPAPAEVKARALRRIDLALSLGAGASSGPGGAPPAPHGPGASALGRMLLKRVPAWSLLVSFVAGGALAVVSTRPAPDRLSTPPSLVAAPLPTATTAVSAPAASAAPVETAPPPTASVSAAAREPSPPRPPSSASARAGSDGGLEAERALLDVARTALGRGDGSNALRAADEHARRFPRGILAEEREAMSIQALRLLPRDDEAGARLDRFRGRFPTSLIRPALEAADGGSP